MRFQERLETTKANMPRHSIARFARAAFILSGALLALLGCRSAQKVVPPSNIQYYSDYFVFVSDDSAAPLVVPIDVNREPRDSEKYFLELKAWRGTEEQWPMLYEVGERPLSDPFPVRWSSVPGEAGFSFTPEKIRVDIAATSLEVQIPPAKLGASVEEPSPLGTIVFTVWKTKARDGDRVVDGWLIHEYIRFERSVQLNPEGSFFERFHWFPLVVGDVFYLVKEDTKRDVRKAFRWRAANGKLETTESKALKLKVTKTAPHAETGRAAVPVAWRIEVPDFELVVDIASFAGHTATGGQKEGGKALYRQALVKGQASGRPVHGMVELILED